MKNYRADFKMAKIVVAGISLVGVHNFSVSSYSTS
jgi:hypothetical protein